MLLFEIITFALHSLAIVYSSETNSNRTEEVVLAKAGTLQQTQVPSNPPSVGKSDSSVVKFVNVKDGQVMTVDGEQATPHLNISARLWNNTDSQKWLLVRRGDVYLILPKRQHKEWATFLKRTSLRGSDSLPAVTVVVGIDVMNGGITQQVLHGRSNQHWQFADAKESRILIASPTRGKCIQEKKAEVEKPSLIQRAKDKIKGAFGSKKPEQIIEPVGLVAADCDDTDTSQMWRAEPILK